MKIKNSKYRWIIDAILFLMFILAFFLDLTGLALHQLLGFFTGLFAVYHLFIHWDWVQSVAVRLFKKTSHSSRAYFMLDMTLFAGFFLIAATGLVISRWLNLPLSNYAGWLNFHILSSLATLILLMVKIALHWRWISSTAHKFFARPQSTLRTESGEAKTTLQAAVSRRNFMKVVIPAGALTVAAAGMALKGLTLPDLENTQTGTVYANAQEVPTARTEENAAVSQAAPSPDNSNIATQTAALPSQPTAAPQSTQAPTLQPLNDSPCTVRCNKKCASPGRCRRYSDSNNNNRCDLGECL